MTRILGSVVLWGVTAAACATARPAETRELRSALQAPPAASSDAFASELGTPELVIQRFLHCMRERDLEGLVALYEPEAIFAPEPTASSEGHERIRATMREVLSLQPEFTLVTVEVFRSGDLALVRNDWKLKATAPDGAPIEKAGRSSVVMRRQPNASWRVVIDRP